MMGHSTDNLHMIFSPGKGNNNGKNHFMLPSTSIGANGERLLLNPFAIQKQIDVRRLKT